MYYGAIVNDVIQYIGTYPDYVYFHGVDRSQIIELEIKEHPDQSPGSYKKAKDYWGWKDTGSNRFTMIYPSYTQFCMCFPYGWQLLAQKGEGMAYRLQINQINNP